jgi:hypothetical protein
MIRYEWCYETVDEHGDILEVDFENELKDFQPDRRTETLCLVRRVGNEIDGEQDRLYAYVTDHKLPRTFSDEMNTPIAIDIPKRFYKEFVKYYKPKN